MDVVLVGLPGPPLAGPKSIGSKGNICPWAASSASISSKGVPALADMTSSFG